jgi:competence protein ComEC
VTTTRHRPTPGLLAAVVAWPAAAAGLWAASLGRTSALLLALALAGAAAALWRRRPTVGALALLAVVAAAFAGARVGPLVSSPLSAGGAVEATVRVTAEPQRRAETAPGSGAGTTGWLVDAGTIEVAVGGGAPLSTELPVVLLLDDAPPRLGATVRVRGEALGPRPLRGSAGAVVVSRWELLVAPPPGQRAASAVRDALRASVRERPEDAAGLLPGLVLGDTAGQSADLEAAMRDSGLAHLTAVSGGNVAVVVLLVVALGRAVGLRRGRGQLVLVAAGVLGYVVLVGAEPSVLRAAAMTAVALLGLATDVRLPGLDVVAWPVAVLLLVDPFLSLSLGFAMSVLATGALLLAVRRTRADPGPGGPARRVLRAVALALGLTAAAQAAVAPLVAGIGGGIPLGGLVANLLAAPAVAPATALGLLAGVLGTIVPAVGTALALPATWATGWIAVTARACADHLPLLPWPDGLTGAQGLAALLAVVGWAWWAARSRAARLVVAALVAAGAVVAVNPALPAVPGPGTATTAGWPPAGWVVVACDVGQGTALVLPAGEGSAVVVDAGPDARALRGCLGRLGVRRVPLVVLSHFHADHVDGLRAVLGLGVGTVVVSPLAEPVDRAAAVRRLLAEAGVREHVAGAGERWSAGPTELEVVWPRRIIRGRGSDPNNASVTLRATVDGVSLVLGGDLEPAAQSAVVGGPAPGRGLGPVDVVVVPHHGSPRQSPAWAATLRPRVALITVGRDNDYGHPAPATLDAYSRLGAAIGRTDRDGDLAVLRLPDGTLALARRTPAS